MPDTTVTHIEGDADEGQGAAAGAGGASCWGPRLWPWRFAGTVPPILIDSSAEIQVQADPPGLQTFAAVSATTDPAADPTAEAPMVTTVPSTPDPAST